MSAALIAYKWPALSRFALAHVFAEADPKAGRHAAPPAPGPLARARRAVARWWRDTITDDEILLERMRDDAPPLFVSSRAERIHIRTLPPVPAVLVPWMGGAR